MANATTLNRSRLATLALLSTVALAAPAWAQVQSGRIVGSVRDAQQAAVPRATVSVASSATGRATNVTTNERGAYVVTPVDPGLYRVTVSLDGFQTAVVNAVMVPVGQSVRVDVELKLGTRAETTEVTAAAPLLDAESGTLGHTVTNTQIVDLPLNGRGFYELARLTPGATGLPGGASVVPIRANFINGTAISGVRGNQLTFQIDGVDVTDHHQGGTYIQTSIDALQEFKVQQSAYSAEFSQAGGMLNAATKSGASEFHGGLFEFLRNDVFDAADYFVRKKQELNRHQFGGTLSGPLVAGKTFFFLSYEGTRESRQLPVNLTVASAGMKQGDFSGIRNRIYDPLTGQPFPGNVIPASRLSPQALYFAGLIPDPNTSAQTYAWSADRKLHADQVTLRIDHNLSAKHKVFVRYSFHDNRMDDPSSNLGAPYLAYPDLGSAHLHTRGQNVVAALTSTLSSDRAERVPFQLPAAGRGPRALRPGHELPAGGRHQGLRGDGPPRRRGLLPGLHVERLQQHERLGLRPASEDPGPEGPGIHRQRDPHPRPPHLEGGDEDPPLAAALHGQQAVPGRLGLQRFRDPEPGERRGHRRRLRRLHAGAAATGHALVPRRHLRRPGDLRPLLRPGRLQGDEPPQPQPGAALRILALGLRLPRPARHLRPRVIEADHRGERNRPDRPRLAVLGTVRLRALQELHPDEQPGGACPCRSRAPTRRSSGRASASPGGRSERGRSCAAATASSSSRRTPTGASTTTWCPSASTRPASTTSPRGGPWPTSSWAGPHHLGRAHPGRDRDRDEDGPQPSLQPRRAAADQPQHRPRGQLRREHRAAPERRAPTSTSPRPRAGGVQARRPYPQFGNISYFDTNMSNTYHSLQTTLVRRASQGPLVHGVLHLLQEHHDPEQSRPSGATPGARRRSRPSTSRTTSRSASASSCRSAAAGVSWPTRAA